jgi:hypothetical protein
MRGTLLLSLCQWAVEIYFDIFKNFNSLFALFFLPIILLMAKGCLMRRKDRPKPKRSERQGQTNKQQEQKLI